MFFQEKGKLLLTFERGKTRPAVRRRGMFQKNVVFSLNPESRGVWGQSPQFEVLFD